MATQYIASTAAAATGTIFTCAPGKTRTFFCVPPLERGESLTLEIEDSDGTFVDVGVLVSTDCRVCAVTGRGVGDTDFRVRKTATKNSVRVDQS